MSMWGEKPVTNKPKKKFQLFMWYLIKRFHPTVTCLGWWANNMEGWGVWLTSQPGEEQNKVFIDSISHRQTSFITHHIIITFKKQIIPIFLKKMLDLASELFGDCQGVEVIPTVNFCAATIVSWLLQILPFDLWFDFQVSGLTLEPESLRFFLSGSQTSTHPQSSPSTFGPLDCYTGPCAAVSLGHTKWETHKQTHGVKRQTWLLLK